MYRLVAQSGAGGGLLREDTTEELNALASILWPLHRATEN